jgi:hypothetical protein
MTIRAIFITAAITAVAVLGTIGSASASIAGISQWELNTQHLTQDAPFEPETIVRTKVFLDEIY